MSESASDDVSSVKSESEDEGLPWDEELKCIKENNPRVKLIEPGEHDIQNMTDEDWEELGRDIANNTHLGEINLSSGALDDQKMSSLFRGLTRSTSIKFMDLMDNDLSVVGVRSMVPFLHNANNLTVLDLDVTNLQSEGFNVVLRALCDSPIKKLSCDCCDIKAIEIDSKQIPKNLKELSLSNNSIDADGCRGLAKLLEGGDATLDELHLDGNEIDDEGMEILVGALQRNKSLTTLDLPGNDGISRRGIIMLLNLLNDISSVEATLQSNHTLWDLPGVDEEIHSSYLHDADEQIQMLIEYAAGINLRNSSNLEAAGREKVIKTQLHSKTRAKLAEIQGVNHSFYSEINPLHLPEVLALVGRCHRQGELYVALKTSIADLISTVNRKECLKQQRDYYLAKAQQLESEIATIEAAEGTAASVRSESRSIKKRRAC